MESNQRQLREEEVRRANLGRHQAQCTICSHLQREKIEEDWTDWGCTAEIAHTYGVSRDALYRHAHAVDLFPKRQKKIKMALEKVIERLDITKVNGSTVLAAIKEYVKLYGQRDGVEQGQGLSPKELFQRMSAEERAAFARDGSLPKWFSSVKGATTDEGQKDENGRQVTETTSVQ